MSWKIMYAVDSTAYRVNIKNVDFTDIKILSFSHRVILSYLILWILHEEITGAIHAQRTYMWVY